MPGPRKHISDWNAKKLIKFMVRDFGDVDPDAVQKMIDYINLFYIGKRTDPKMSSVDPDQTCMIMIIEKALEEVPEEPVEFEVDLMDFS